MTTMRFRYLDMIGRRVEATYKGDLDDVKAWFDHWIASGLAIRDEFEKEGLHETAKFIEKEVEWQRKYSA